MDQQPLAAARARGSVSADLARRPKASQSRAAEGSGGGKHGELRRRRRRCLSNRPAWPRPPRRVGDGGRLRAPLLLLLLLSLFFIRPPLSRERCVSLAASRTPPDGTGRKMKSQHGENSEGERSGRHRKRQKLSKVWDHFKLHLFPFYHRCSLICSSFYS